MKKLLKAVTLLAVVFLSGCCTFSLPPSQYTRAARAVGDLPPEHRQAISVIVDQEWPKHAYILVWEREGEWWANQWCVMPAVIGRNSLAAPGEKREGDGRTPSGTYALKRAFGYAPQMETGLDYTQVGDQDFWVDDPASVQYNQWVTGTPAAASYETLKRTDKLYQYAVVVEYNTDSVVKDLGSAIFLHVWRNQWTPTAGCVATSAHNMKKILKWLDLSKKPVIILGD